MFVKFKWKMLNNAKLNVDFGKKTQARSKQCEQESLGDAFIGVCEVQKVSRAIKNNEGLV